MVYATKSIASRIDWCQRQSTQVCASRELDEWQAEVEGLRDALFNQDHTTQYQLGPPSVFERYALGLQDGHALLRTAAIDLTWVNCADDAGKSNRRMGAYRTRRPT